MYAPEEISSYLSQIDPEVILNPGTGNEKVIPFELTYHSVDEVRIANDYFDSLIDMDAYKASCESSNTKIILKNPKYQFTVDELVWMENERIICKWDCNYFQDRYYKILDHTGNYIQFAPLVPQLVNRRIRGRLQKAKRAIRKWTVKARQQGETSDSQGIILHRLTYFNDVKSLISSLDSDSSGKMAGMFTEAMKLLPYWNRPKLKSHTTGAEYEYENGSLLDIGWGTQDKLGRGRTPLIAHCCLSPNTLIITANGNIKAITEIVVGDTVLTSAGRLAKVKCNILSARKNEITSEIALWGNFIPLSCTRDHLILTPEGFKKAQDVKTDSFVSIPVRKIQGNLKECALEYKAYRTSRNNTKLTIPFNFDTGWLIGLYLAEGSVRKQGDKKRIAGLTFTVHENEAENIVSEITRITTIVPKIRENKKGSKARNIVLNSTVIANWMADNFGFTDSKNIPDWVWETNLDFCRGITKGYIDGDGYIEPDSNMIRVTSVRVSLLIQLRNLCASLGYGWSSIIYRQAGNYYNRNCRDTWTLAICGDTGRTLREDLGYDFDPALVREFGNHWKFRDNGNFVDIQVKTNSEGFSESFYDIEVDSIEHDFCTIQCCVHNSEIPFYKYPEKALEEALFNAKHETIWELLLMEGTAEKRDDYYHKKTKEIIEGMESHLTSFAFCFHPWCARRDLFPTDAWITARAEAYYNWQPSTETIAHATKVERWVKNNQDYREVYQEVLGHPFRFDREQLFYYEVEKNAAKKRNALHAFLKEKPSDPDEAFQNAGQTIYPIETIIELSDKAKATNPDVYKIRGDLSEVPSVLFPSEDEIDYSKPIIEIKAHWNQSIPASYFDLVPIIFNGWDGFTPNNKFLIWEHPRNGASYGNGIDTADGLGELVSDDAIQEIVKKGTIEYNDKQVCEFASYDLPQNVLWSPTLAISTYYSPDEQLLLVPEINKGTELLTAMINRGWVNIHKMMDMTKPGIDPTTIKKYGFETNRQTRPDLVNHFNSLIFGKWLDILSKYLIEELKDLTIKTTVSPMLGAINKKILGKNDNRFMAIAMVLYSLHREAIAGREKAAWELRTRNENSRVTLKEFKGFSYERDETETIYFNESMEEEIDELVSAFSEEGY